MKKAIEFQEVLNDSDINGKSYTVEQMVGKYMEVVHTSILDMAPKYIIMSLVQETIRYAKEDLSGDLLPMGITPKKVSALMETSPEDKRRLEQVKTTKAATEHALSIVQRVSNDEITEE